MQVDPKLSKYFEKLKSEFNALEKNPNKQHLEKFKGELKQFMNEINNWRI